MSIVSDNLRFLRKKAGYTQQSFADAIDIKRSLLGAYEEGRADPRLNNLIKIAEVFGFSVDTLISINLTEKSSNELEKLKSTQKIIEQTKILALTVDREGNEHIDLIPQKAFAGYLNGYSDPEYIEELPKFNLPFLPKDGTYRAFEITGDSMLPIKNGDIIIARYIENNSALIDGKTYILLTANEGVVYKRVYFEKHTEDLLLKSDNEIYKPYTISKNDVLEMWEAKSFFSQNLPQTNLEEIETSNMKNITNLLLEIKNELSSLKGK